MSKLTSNLLCITFLIITSNALGQTTLWVDDDNCPGPGTGTELDPLCSIQRAIELSLSDSEIAVKPGTYNELIDFIGKAITLRSTDGPEVTIIDASSVAITLRGKTVVRFDSGEVANSIIQGFTIKGGTGDITLFGDKTSRGGGVFVSFSNPTMKNCIIIDNNADEGGGIFINKSTMTMAECTINGNDANIEGGGMFNNNSNPKITNCTFSENNAQSNGGGMFCENSSPMIYHSMFVDNNAITKNGGGMYNANDSNTIVFNCAFSGNVTSSSNNNFGGGMFNSNNSNVKVINCRFSGNNCNGSSSGGGGIYNSSSELTVINSTFTGNGNINLHGGGGIRSFGGTTLATNCTFWGNSASSGGAIIGSGHLTVINCLIWGNNVINGEQISYSTSHFMFSNIEGCRGSDNWNCTGVDVGGNIDSDPLFVDPDGEDDIAGTLDDDLRLMPNSPAIDAGINLGPQFDIDGNLRIVDDPATTDTGVGFPNVIDMGAFEFGSSNHSSDYDNDGDTDLSDFAQFMNDFNGLFP